LRQESLNVTTGKRSWRIALALIIPLAAIAGCSSGTSNKGSKQIPDAVSLDVADVQKIIAQAVFEAKAQNRPATIGVIDRVGNVLGIYKMTGATAYITITSGSSVKGGLEGATGNPAIGNATEQAVLIPENAVIAKALTAAYFSSKGNAFSSRAAAQILQENFTPGEKNKSSGPLFGVQFSQLSCSDVAQRLGSVGPKRSPLGFAADPGGIPLYKNGSVVGAVGVMADENYSVDRDAADVDNDVDELIAFAAANGFEPPEDIRADRITIEGRNLRFVDSEALATNPASAPAFGTLVPADGVLVALPGYTAGAIVDGTKYGLAESGVRPAATANGDPQAYVDVQGYVVVNGADANRFAPVDGAVTGGQQLTAADVTALLAKSIEVANKARSQVRRPVGSTAQVHSVVVDTTGAIIGALRSPDALVDAIDVVPQKARTAVFFSQTGAAAALAALPAANYLPSAGGGTSNIGDYVTASQTFFGNASIFADGTAFSTRSINNIATPTFPDGIAGKPNGPLAKPEGTWSIFNNGLNLDLVYNQIINFLANPNDPVPVTGCTGDARIFNGITLFGGGIPIFKNGVLVGAIGSSGDGTEQSDLIAYLAVEQSGRAGITNAPKSIRADNLEPQGVRLRYVLCPFAPFNGSTDQNVCGD
jgi:uncharacterized protein GlcG (DUF336 family)